MRREKSIPEFSFTTRWRQIMQPKTSPRTTAEAARAMRRPVESVGVSTTMEGHGAGVLEPLFNAAAASACIESNGLGEQYSVGDALPATVTLVHWQMGRLWGWPLASVKVPLRLSQSAWVWYPQMLAPHVRVAEFHEQREFDVQFELSSAGQKLRTQDLVLLLHKQLVDDVHWYHVLYWQGLRMHGGTRPAAHEHDASAEHEASVVEPRQGAGPQEAELSDHLHLMSALQSCEERYPQLRLTQVPSLNMQLSSLLQSPETEYLPHPAVPQRPPMTEHCGTVVHSVVAS